MAYMDRGFSTALKRKNFKGCIKLIISILIIFTLMSAGSISAFAETADSSTSAFAEQADTDSILTASAEQTIVDEAASGDTVLRIYRSHSEDSTPFNMPAMLPGDTETHAYFVQVSYRGTLTLNFHADIDSGYEKMAEVLKCRVSLRDGETLYDGLMKDMPEAISYQLPDSNGKTAKVIYDITVYLDTSVGNEYMNRELYADFRWWVDAENSTSGSGSSGDDSEGSLIRTGDDTNILMWASIAGAALLLCIILLFAKRRRKEAEDEQ